MNQFYKLGSINALEKLGFGAAWKNLAPATQGLIKRVGVGTGVGAVGGAMAGGEGNRGTGALLGGLAGAGGMAGAGHLMQRGLRGQAADAMRQSARLARQGGTSGVPVARAMRKSWEPALDTASSRIFPRINEQEMGEIGTRFLDKVL
jgi:hypothetical protein